MSLSINAHKGFGTIKQLSGTIGAVVETIFRRSLKLSGTVPNRWISFETLCHVFKALRTENRDTMHNHWLL